jgi:predicted dehydrogenase
MHDRRRFLAATAGLALGTRMPSARAQGANNRVRIGTIGTGGRARGLMNLLKRVSGAELVAVCDVYEPRMAQAAEIAGTTAIKVGDYRRVLDNREIDAVLIGTPDHWHKQMTLDALAAGKDVYVEKPVSHSIEDGVAMVKAVEGSKQIVQTGMQQRSWEHWVLAKQLIDAGRLGQITYVQTYWYQHATFGNFAPVTMAALDWKGWLGPARDQPFDPARFYQWRHYWDFGGGGITDLMTHWIDAVQWYLGVDAPLTAITTGAQYQLKGWEAPDTVTVTLEFPKNFIANYLQTYVSRVDDGGVEIRGDKGTIRIDRARMAFYRDDAAFAPGTNTPEPDIYVRSSGDGSLTHLQNWVDCIRSRRQPNAPMRIGHQAARTSHIANAALKAGRRVRWNATTERVEV